MNVDQDVSGSFQDLTLIHHNKPLTHFELHAHDGPECIVPLFGDLCIHFPDLPQTVELKAGQMIIIPENLPHTAKSPSPFGERLILLLNGLRLPCQQMAVLPRSQLLTELCFELFEENDSELQAALVDLIYRLLLRKISSRYELIINTNSLMGRCQDERVKKVLQMFSDNPGIDLKMAAISKRCGLSERSMQRLFKTELGLSPLHVLTLYRMEKAIQLIRSGESVTHTALSVGYGSLSQFIAQFRSITGRIPSDFQ